VTSETGARRPRSISNFGGLCQTRKTPTLKDTVGALLALCCCCDSTVVAVIAVVARLHVSFLRISRKIFSKIFSNILRNYFREIREIQEKRLKSNFCVLT
jgi:hypothetical protein